MARAFHLARRLAGSLSRRPLDPCDGAWVASMLSPAELALWEQLPAADRKHAAGVARDVDARLGGAPVPVLAAALLHDVGKIRSGLGTPGRVVATVVGLAIGRLRAASWEGEGFGGRIGTYLRHDSVGADLLVDAGADPLTVAWAREHHLPRDRWSVPLAAADALAAADDD